MAPRKGEVEEGSGKGLLTKGWAQLRVLTGDGKMPGTCNIWKP